MSTISAAWAYSGTLWLGPIDKPMATTKTRALPVRIEETDMTITPEVLVQREVKYCVSSLVSTLAGGYSVVKDEELSGLTAMAAELCYTVPDYEEAATQDGWKKHKDEQGTSWRKQGEPYRATAEDVCAEYDIEPYEREVFEHWLVSDWLADKLAELGEKVEKDFMGLTIWARTTAGQAISGDWVIEEICKDLNAA